MSFFGRRSSEALEEQVQRAALGLKAPRRHKKAGPRRKRFKIVPWPAGQPAPPEAFATCQQCGAIRLPNAAGKLAPHRCSA